MAHVLELTIVDAVDGVPVVDATIKVNAPDLEFSLVSDARGVAMIEFPVMPRHVGVRVRKAGFVPRLIAWDPGVVGEPLPERFTIPLERAHSIGGFVRNQSGEPVAGANVLITLRGPSPQGVQPRLHNEIWESPATTDAGGRWRFDDAAADLEHLHVRLEHPEYISNEHIATLPPPEDFRNGTAVLTAIKGVTCEGTVTDERGNPLPHVKVICGEDGEDSTSTPTRRTDAQGHFRFGRISLQHHGKGAILSFLKKSYAPIMIELQPATTLIRKDVTLRPGKSLRVRFTDKDGVPIQGAILAVNSWKRYRPFHLRFVSNETGLAVWENAPADELGYAILHESYQNQDVLLTATDDIQTLILKRPMTVSGRVVDAETRQPIPAFSLIRGSYFPERHPGGSHWNHAWVYPFTNGVYRSSASRPVRIGSADGGPGEEGFHRLRISAPGYKPAISRPIANDEENAECHFELECGGGVEGSVKKSDGSPAAGVDLVVAGPGNSVSVQNGITHGHQFRVTTDEQGRYVLPPQEEDFPIVIAHPGAGYRVTSFSELQAVPDVQLLAWGRLELATAALAESQAKYYLRPVLGREHRKDRVHFNSTPVTAGEGLWAFECLVAGRMYLGTANQPMHPGPEIVIENGQTARLDFRSGRRVVVGRILLPPEGISTEEPLANCRLRTVSPEPQLGLNEQQLKAWAAAFRSMPEKGRISEVSFELDFQGRFRIADIAPGSYRLQVIFFKSMHTEPNSRPDIAGLAHKDFELPVGEEDFDLGAIPVLPPNERSL
jgi:hypothetical protein